MECLKTRISHSMHIFETKHESEKLTSEKKLAEIYLDKFTRGLYEYSF